jgi:hypothetical protein
LPSYSGSSNDTGPRHAIADPEITAEIKFGLVVAVEGDGARPEDYLDLAAEAARTARSEVPNIAEIEL